MNETLGKVIRVVLILVVFILSIALIVTGQKNIGAEGLAMMLAGLAMLLLLLWYYNRKYK